ncbi:MAG: UDP-N-acetylmuramate--L-alanine ligase [Thermoleophilia bacterium]|nr:UDP-N-acetylmuramate--L-alanine ligase [Thermoleophilia bacterium]
MSRTRESFPQPVHFIGIGGAGMSAIALVLHQMGVLVAGSDLKQSRYTRRLSEGGVPVAIGHRAENLGDAAVVVVSSAIPRGNPELRAARQRGLPVLQRAEMLARLMATRRGISVAGTHGKTTTSSMVSHVLHGAGLDPTYVIGGELNEMASNAGLGHGEWLVAETDESDGSLVHLRPEIAAVMNLEMDHHANFSCLDEIRDVFHTFVGLLPPDGLLVLVEGTGTESLRAASTAPVSTVGIDAGDWQAHVERVDSFSSEFTVRRGEEELGVVRLRVGGVHNVVDALVCLAIVDRCGLGVAEAAAPLATFSGAARRFDEVGRPRGVLVYDDYAHHPTEIEATLNAANLGGHRKVIAVFQPHLYSRTRHLQREFGRVLTLADEAVVTDITGVREEPEPGITGKLIVDAYLAARPGGPVRYLPRNADVVRYLRDRVRPGDLVLTIGAGDIHTVAAELVALLDDGAAPSPATAAAGRD